MNIDVPAGFSITSFGGNCVVPGTRIHLRQLADGQPFIGVVGPDGVLQMEEEPRTVRYWPGPWARIASAEIQRSLP